MCVTVWFGNCNHSHLFSCGFKQYSFKCFSRQIIEDSFCTLCFKNNKHVRTQNSTLFNVGDLYGLLPLQPELILDGLIV